MDNTPLQVQDFAIGYPGNIVATNIDFTLKHGSFTALMGSNGAGKSTLVKSMLGLIPPVTGNVAFFGEQLNQVRPLVAYVPQRNNIDLDFPITAYDVVLLGTYPRRGFGKRVRKEDKEAAARALTKMGVADLSQRRIGTLSGGQLQRVFLARALAQGAEFFILDEPLTGVDHASERVITHQLRELTEAGKTILAVHHNLATVGEYFDDILLLEHSLIAHGPAKDVIRSEEWCNIFSVITPA